MFYRSKSIPDRITAFKEDLKKYDAGRIVNKYFLSGYSDCFLLDHDTYVDIVDEISDRFNVENRDVCLVGSAQLGFSIAPTKRYSPFSNESDIDIAIISTPLFDEIWKGLYNFSLTNKYWPDKKMFLDYLFRGWIRPDMFPRSRYFSLGGDWWEFFRELTRKHTDYKIAGALYKDSYFFRTYQERSVTLCIEEIRGIVL